MKTKVSFTNQMCWLAILQVLLFPGIIQAGNQEQRISELEQKVQQLEKRIAQLEEIFDESTNSGLEEFEPRVGDYKLRENWRKLEFGISKNQVRQLLGEPPNINADSFIGDRWYYPDALGGYIKFDTSGKLEKWDEPKFTN